MFFMVVTMNLKNLKYFVQYRLRIPISIIMLCILFVSCEYFSTKPYDQKKQWTIMLYIDEDTSPISAGRFHHMKNILRSSEFIDVVVLEDQSGKTANYWYLDKEYESVLLEQLPEVNMGDYHTLYDFVKYSKDYFPAHRYLLVLYDHGGAWQGACWDQSHNMDNLKPIEIEIALKANRGVDITLLVACTMGAIEPIYQLCDVTDVYIGSENAAFYEFFGRAWDEIISMLTLNFLKDTEWLGNEIVNAIWNAEGVNIEEQIPEMTISAIRTKVAPSLIGMIDDVSKSYLENFANFKTNLDNILPTIKYNRANKVDFYDLIYLLHIEEKDHDLKAQLLEILNISNQMIINEKHGTVVEFSHGFSIYLPIPDIEPYNQYYSSSELGLKFANSTHWDELLERYYQESDYTFISKNSVLPLPSNFE